MMAVRRGGRLCRKRLQAVTMLWLLLLAGCSGAAVATPRPVVVTIGGATSLQPVMQELTTEYSRRHPNVLFTLRGGGSTLGEEQVLRGRVTLGASTLFPPETPPASQRNLVRVPVGVDGLAIIVHAGNIVPSLTLDQLRGLYSGDILDWETVGGDEGEVILVSREDGSGARRLFDSRVMGDESVSLTAVVMPTSHDVVQYVAKTPSAIGYVSRAWVIDALNERASLATRTPDGTPTPHNVVVVPVEEKLPTLANLRDGSYALIQPLYLISRGEARGATRQFLDFVLSPAGQNIVRRYHLPAR